MMPSTLPNTKPRTMDTENVVVKQVLADLNRFREDLGESHEKVAETWNSLGLIRLHMQQDADEAKVCFEEALRIFTQHDSQSSIAITLNDLGYCHERLLQQEEAMNSYKKARELLEAQKYSESHPRMISTQRSLARLMRE
jgi:tetratricopeptide (TPR) repeat protein